MIKTMKKLLLVSAALSAVGCFHQREAVQSQETAEESPVAVLVIYDEGALHRRDYSPCPAPGKRGF